MYEGNPHHLWPADETDPQPQLVELFPADDPAAPLAAIIALEMREAGIELGPEAIDIAIKLGRQRHHANIANETSAAKRQELLAERKQCVYYMRRGILVKIGTTIDLRTRFRNLRPDEVLAVEPGGYDLEAERHAQFRDLKVPGEREYFYPGAALQAHIADLVAEHGPPDPSLPVAPQVDAS